MLDVLNTPTDTPATDTPASDSTAIPTMHAHFASCLYNHTIAELAAEWHRLQKWDESDEYGDHGDCRLDRMADIERLLSHHRNAKSADDVIKKWAVLEQRECADNQYGSTVEELIEWEADHHRCQIESSFEHVRTSDLLRSIMQDLHKLTRHPDGSWCTCNNAKAEPEREATIEPETVVEVVDPSVFRDGTKEGDLAIVREGSDDVTLELLLVHKDAGLIRQLCAPAAVRVAERFTKAA